MLAGGWKKGWRSLRAGPWALLAVLALTVLAAWLRLHELGSHGFWRDEAICTFIAQKDFPAGILAALHQEAHPPLYYSLLHFWIELFGWSEFRIRLFSAGWGILTVPALYLVGQRFFGRCAGLAAALIGAAAPLHLAVSQAARGYAMLAFWALLSIWLLYEAWERGGLWWLGYGLATLVILYTHNWAMFLVLSQNLYALWRLLRRREGLRRLWTWVGVQVAVVGLFAPWVPVLLRQVGFVNVLPFVPIPSPAEKLWALSQVVLAPWPALLLWAALLVLGLWPRKAEAEAQDALVLVGLSLWGTLIVGLGVSLNTYGQVPPYVMMAAFGPLCLLLGRGLTRLRPAWVTLLLAALVAGLSLHYQPAVRYLFRSSVREIAQTVRREAGPNDMIVLAPDYLAPAFNTYFPGDQPQIAFPGWNGRLEWIPCEGWNARWEGAEQAVPATLDVVEQQLRPDGRLWLVAALDEFPDETRYYGQVRRLKAELDQHLVLERSIDTFRNAPEWGTIFVYRRR